MLIKSIAVVISGLLISVKKELKGVSLLDGRMLGPETCRQSGEPRLPQGVRQPPWQTPADPPCRQPKRTSRRLQRSDVVLRRWRCVWRSWVCSDPSAGQG